MSETHHTHNWNCNDYWLGGPACLRCGVTMFNILHEIRDKAKEPCPGRKPIAAPSRPSHTDPQ